MKVGKTLACCFFPYHHCPSLSSHNAKSLCQTFGKHCNAKGQDTEKGTGCPIHNCLSVLLPAPFLLFIFILSCPHCQKMPEKLKKGKEKEKKIFKGLTPPSSPPPPPALVLTCFNRWEVFTELQKRTHDRRDLLPCLSLCCLGRML